MDFMIIGQFTTWGKAASSLDHHVQERTRGNDFLLLIVGEGETSAGNGKLDEKDEEKNDHVEEKTDLMMPDRAHQS